MAKSVVWEADGDCGTEPKGLQFPVQAAGVLEGTLAPQGHRSGVLGGKVGGCSGVPGELRL